METAIARLTALAALLGLAACQRSEQPAVTDTGSISAAAGHALDSAQPGEIPWFKGTLDAAFAAASAENKPVFLYWGAEWCPPCHDLKAHVFSRRDFQQKLQQFVPVYVDGDAEGAQRIAGEFQVAGYPTAVVLRADRTEVARIAGGMDLSRYADVLDLALEGVRPLPEVLAALRGDASRALTQAECRRMAWNAWLLDPQLDDDDDAGALADALQLAAQRCPSDANIDRDRLLVTAAGLAAAAERKDVEAGKPPSPRLASLVAGMRGLLADRQRSAALADALLDVGDDFFIVAHHADPARSAPLRRDWFAVMDALAADARYSDTLRLMSAAGKLYAAKALDAQGKVPPDVAAQARATLADYMGRTWHPDARAGVVNSASWVLTYLGDDAALRTLLQAEIGTSRTAFYYMSDLADVEERMGNQQQALQWLARAYSEAKGPATRFQWGVLYVEGLLRMAPQDETRIREAALAVIGELQGPDRIHARTRTRVDRLHQGLVKWARETGSSGTLTALGQRWQGICAAMPAADPVRRECPRMMAAPAARIG